MASRLLRPTIAPLTTVALVALVALVTACERQPTTRAPAPTDDQTADGAPAEAHDDASGEEIEVTLCDDKTKATIAADGPIDRVMAQSVADELMAKWKRDNPEVDWEADERASRTFIPAHDNSHLVVDGDEAAQGTTYRSVSERDVLLWKRETEKAVVAGSRVFHSADELGSTIAVSCDMCHPNAANTHPETYPKFQSQLGRVALLRDMINWCLMHPSRAPPMEADDPRMRAMEAYIISQRAGEVMAYGKH